MGWEPPLRIKFRMQILCLYDPNIILFHMGAVLAPEVAILGRATKVWQRQKGPLLTACSSPVRDQFSNFRRDILKFRVWPLFAPAPWGNYTGKSTWPSSRAMAAHTHLAGHRVKLPSGTCTTRLCLPSTEATRCGQAKRSGEGGFGGLPRPRQSNSHARQRRPIRAQRPG